jgi:hypothetical protein
MSIKTKIMDIKTVHPKRTFRIDFIIAIEMERTPLGMVG